MPAEPPAEAASTPPSPLPATPAEPAMGPARRARLGLEAAASRAGLWPSLAAIGVLAFASAPAGLVVALVGLHALWRAEPLARHWLAGGIVLALSFMAAFLAPSEALLLALPLALGLFLVAGQRRAAALGAAAAPRTAEEVARFLATPAPGALALRQLAVALAVAAALFLAFPSALLAPSGAAPEELLSSAQAKDLRTPSSSRSQAESQSERGVRPEKDRSRERPARRPAGGRRGGAQGDDEEGGPDPRTPDEDDDPRRPLGSGWGDGEAGSESGSFLDPFGRNHLFRRGRTGLGIAAAYLRSRSGGPSLLGFALALLASLVLVWLFLPRALRRRVAGALSGREPASPVDFWDRFLSLLERRGLLREPGETGRALAARAAERMPAAEVRLVVETFYRVAYGGAALTLGERRRVLDAVSRLERFAWEEPAGEGEGSAA